MNILITGASGFIGSFIVEEALRRGFDTDFSSKDKLVEQLRGHDFDYVVHAAGVTKCLHPDDFFRVNYEGTRNLVEAILELHMPMRRFIYMSSLSIFGAIREQQPYHNITEHDTPRPNTAYGRSKLMAEKFLDSVGNEFNYIVLRPTGVYGPREKDYYLMAKSIKQHVDFAVGFKRQDITFVYVKDVVQAVFLALDHGMSGRKYFLSDGEVYQSSTFSNELRQAMGRPWWIRIKAPIAVLRLITWCGEYYGRLTGHITALNNDKYNILRQRNWRCDIEPACDELGFHPQYQLHRGVQLTVKWYQENNWL